MVRRMLAAGLAAMMMVPGCMAGSGAIAMDGYGVRFGKEGQVVELDDVALMIGRVLGFDVQLEAGDKEELPTGDMFNRAKGMLLVAVDGVDLDMVKASESQVPNLHKMFSSNNVMTIDGDKVQEFSLYDPKVSQAFSYGASSLKDLIQAQSEHSVFIAAGLDNDMTDAVNAPIKVQGSRKEEGATIESEIDLFKTVPESISQELVHDQHPDVIVLSVSSLRNKDTVLEGLATLDKALPELFGAFQNLYNDRLATQVVLLGEPTLLNDRRVLQNSTTQAPTKSPTAQTTTGAPEPSGPPTRFQEWVFLNDTADYLIQTWTAVALFFILLLIFFCMSWTDELDPILYSGLAKDDMKKD